MESGDVVPGRQLSFRLMHQSVKVLRPWEPHSALLGECLCFTTLSHVWCCSKLGKLDSSNLNLASVNLAGPGLAWLPGIIRQAFKG